MRREQYARVQAPVDPAGRIVIIVDDGIATGSSMVSAIRSVRARKAVGQFFDDLSEVTDDMVLAALARPPIAVTRQYV